MYAIGIPGAILLCLGVPVSTLCIMLSIRKRLRQPRTTATFGFLYHQFKCAGYTVRRRATNACIPTQPGIQSWGCPAAAVYI